MISMKMTTKRVYVLFRLYENAKQIGSKTVKDIAIFLEGTNWTRDTYEFLQELRYAQILFCPEKNNVFYDSNNRSHPMYKVNKEKIANLWKMQVEYRLSKKIIEDEATFGSTFLPDD